MKKFLNEFREFAVKGSVIDLAVGVLIGAAFQGIVKAFVNDMIMPIVSLCTGGLSFENWFVALDGNHYNTFAQAQEAGAATINFGAFIMALINFLIVAFVVFLMVKAINAARSLRDRGEEVPVTVKICPYCKTEISVEAKRCPNCTSDLEV